MALVTDQGAVYLRILRKLQISERLKDVSNIYIAYQPLFDPTNARLRA